jgi:hypothetical protein
MLFISQVAAVSCADTQVPETTVANQSLLKVGFCKAIQLEVLVIRIGGKFCFKMQQHDYAAFVSGRFSFKRIPPNPYLMIVRVPGTRASPRQCARVKPLLELHRAHQS